MENEVFVPSVTPKVLQKALLGREGNDAGQHLVQSGPSLSLINGAPVSEARRSVFDLAPLYKPIFSHVAESQSHEGSVGKTVEYRDVYETRAIYERQAIFETTVVGNRDLSDVDSPAEAGLGKSDKVRVQVGDNSPAVLKFSDRQKITVEVDGAKQTFSYSTQGGSFRSALLDAFNSIAGLTATFTPGKQLSLQTDESQPLTLADQGRRSAKPLADLGLAEGTFEEEVVGYNRVQIGTEQVKIGEEAVLVDTKPAATDVQQAQEAYELEMTGLERSDLYELITLSTGLDDYSDRQFDYVTLLFGAKPTEVPHRLTSTTLSDVESVYKSFG